MVEPQILSTDRPEALTKPSHEVNTEVFLTVQVLCTMVTMRLYINITLSGVFLVFYLEYFPIFLKLKTYLTIHIC